MKRYYDTHRTMATPFRSWTGRSAVSRVTGSAVPTVVTSGNFRTRVSAVRGVAPVTGRAQRNTTQRSERGGAAHVARDGKDPMR